MLSDFDRHLFSEGKHYQLHKHLGAQLSPEGVRFSVWAPNASQVFVIGDFNYWDRSTNELKPVKDSGVWTGVVPSAKVGDTYKYFIKSNYSYYEVEKADPLGFQAELRPNTASVVSDLDYSWSDNKWLENRINKQAYGCPISTYEIHLGSWRHCDGSWMTYREIAEPLANYVSQMGFTHVELMPITEHPFDGSWGYQAVGLFAPTSRYGSPTDFKYLIDVLHQAGIGVILDWVPAHFPKDQHGLSFFDGTHLYEHADPRKSEQKDWGTLIYNFGRNEVRSFLISNALFWLDEYHIDGLRVDAVASMLYLDYSKEDGEWIPNEHGGRENLEALDFLRSFNEQVYLNFPDCLTVAEESTSWGGISRPTDTGGVGFGYKWDMGWMNDTLRYFSKEPVHRSHHQNELSFRMIYAFTENFMLPISHDEVVHGKGSLLSKMPGDFKQKFDNTRAFLGYMYGQPGKKLLFMGSEFGQWEEWSEAKSIDWHLLEHSEHRGLQAWVKDLNNAYKKYSAFHHFDCDPSGFSWIDCSDANSNVYTWLRFGDHNSKILLFVCNFSASCRENYRIGVPNKGVWKEVLNSDAEIYGGGGVGNFGKAKTEEISWHGHPNSLSLTLPPLSTLVFSF